MGENADQKKLHIWTLFTHCYFRKKSFNVRRRKLIKKGAKNDLEKKISKNYDWAKAYKEFQGLKV